MWPKEIFYWNSPNRNSAISIAEIRPKPKFRPKMGITAEISIFGRNSYFRPKYLLSAKMSAFSAERSCQNFGQKSKLSAENGYFGRNSHFRPKIAVSAELWLRPNFGYLEGRISVTAVSAKNLFRSHTTGIYARSLYISCLIKPSGGIETLLCRFHRCWIARPCACDHVTTHRSLALSENGHGFDEHFRLFLTS